MSRKKWNRLAPWKGNTLIGYEGNAQDDDVVWRPADEPIELTLTFIRFFRGRSAAHALFRTDADGEVVVHLEELAKILRRGGLDASGSVRGRWVVRKNGNNFTLAPHEEGREPAA